MKEGLTLTGTRRKMADSEAAVHQLFRRLTDFKSQ